MKLMDVIRDAALVVEQTAGGGDCLFHALHRHLAEFRGQHLEPDNLRRTMVDFMLHDDLSKRFLQDWMEVEVDIPKLYTCASSDKTTWPPPQCCFALSQIFRIKSIFYPRTNENPGGNGAKLWSIGRIQRMHQRFPPVPSSNQMCLRFSNRNSHFDLLLGKQSRTPEYGMFLQRRLCHSKVHL